MTLAERLEAATGPDRAIDYDIAHLTGDHFRNNGKAPTYTASIDAALTLVPEGWEWSVKWSGNSIAKLYEKPGWQPIRVYAATPALALAAAAIRAREI